MTNHARLVGGIRRSRRQAASWLLFTLGLLRAGAVGAADTAGATLPVVTEIYKTVADRSLHMFIHKPADWHAEDRRPALVMIHGGGWVGGGITVFDRQSEYFAGRGLVCFVIEYRLLDKRNLEPPLLCIQDARSAMRWVRAHAAELGVDPARIGAMGASAGGHLAAFLGMMDGGDDPQDDFRLSARAQAMLLLNPVLHNGPGPFGYGYKRTAARYGEFSPFHNVTAAAAPAIVFLGDKDKLIPVAMIEEFGAAMKQAGVRCDVHVYPGQGHSFFGPRNEGGKYLHLTLAAMDRFLVELGWLRPAETPVAPNAK